MPAESVRTAPGRRLALAAAVLLYTALLLELGNRAYASFDSGLSFLAPNFKLSFYEEARPLVEREAPVVRDDATLDVLLLGGSVLYHPLADVDDQLTAELGAALKRPVVVHNLAKPAHTSLDSLIKYRMFDRDRFDLVVFYHGINDARMNAAPPDRFRDDYTHGAWYARLQAIDRHRELPWWVTPYVLHTLWIHLSEELGWAQYQPRHNPLDYWEVIEDYVRTDRTVRAHVTEICAIAAARSDPLVLVTFATHLPPAYDLDRPSRQQRKGVDDFAGGGGSALEMWGKPQTVMKAVALHNEVIRETARACPGATLFDMAKRMPDDGALFTDVCHLSQQGADRYVELIVPALLDSLSASSTASRFLSILPLSVNGSSSAAAKNQ